MIHPPVSTVARISVLLVDDHLMFREHLRDLIARDGTMVVFGEAQSASVAYAAAGGCAGRVAIAHRRSTL